MIPRTLFVTILTLLSLYPIDSALSQSWHSFTRINPILKIVQNSQTLAEQAKAFSVRIDRDGDGSGVIVGRDKNTYVVLTNWHVVDDPGIYNIGTPDGQSYRVNKKQQLSGLDLAVLYFESPRNYAVAKFGNSAQLKQGEALSLSGFPSKTLPGFENRPQQFDPNMTISSLEVKVVGGYSISLRGSATEGLSGSPLINKQGELVAIYGKAPAFDSFVYAIPINKAKQAAQQSGINFGKDSGAWVLTEEMDGLL